VRRINEDDRSAFSELYREYLESMVGFAFRIVRSLTVAEDLCADIFVAVWQQRERWQPKHGARAYLFNAVRMRALNHVRHDATVSKSRGAVAEQYRRDTEGNAHSSYSSSVHSSSSIEDRLDFDRKIASIRNVIASMPEMRRRVMQLRWHEGFEITEIAEVLGVSRAAVDQHLSRGLRAIREQLPELMAED
jgi:RNA polymerase sigma-70 factor (ECF subfamily)